MKLYFENIRNYDKNHYKKWFSEMSDFKKRKVVSVKDDNHKMSLILSAHIARLAVSEELNIETNDVVFSYGTHEMPFIMGNEIYFNVSHKGNYVVCITDTNPCGIDIETKREVKLNSAKRFCNENEMKFIENSEDKSSALLYIWTRKDAYFKSLGCGISTILTAVDVLKTEGFETTEEEDYILSTYIKKT